jgi:hypothetical protein
MVGKSWSCHTHGEIRNAYNILVGKPEVNVVDMLINLRICEVTV